MDKKSFDEVFERIIKLAIDVSALVGVSADSCERNDMTEQEIPLRLAYDMQQNLIDEIEKVSIKALMTYFHR